MIADTAPLVAALAITLGLVEALKFALKLAWNKRNGGNYRGNPGNPNGRCKYSEREAGVMNERLAEILRCLKRVEDKLG